MKPSPFTPLQQRYISIYNRHLTAGKIAAKFNCEIFHVQNYRRYAGLRKPTLILTEDQKQFILDHYEDWTDTELAKKFNVKKMDIGNFRRNNGLTKRTKAGKLIAGFFDVDKMKNWAV